MDSRNLIAFLRGMCEVCESIWNPESCVNMKYSCCNPLQGTRKQGPTFLLPSPSHPAAFWAFSDTRFKTSVSQPSPWVLALGIQGGWEWSTHICSAATGVWNQGGVRQDQRSRVQTSCLTGTMFCHHGSPSYSLHVLALFTEAR